MAGMEGSAASKLTLQKIQGVRVFDFPCSWTGAAAFAFTQAVEQGQSATYNMLLRAMRYALKNGPHQHFAHVPELSSTTAFDLNSPLQL